jgi:hypothetical protein
MQRKWFSRQDGKAYKHFLVFSKLVAKRAELFKKNICQSKSE